MSKPGLEEQARHKATLLDLGFSYVSLNAAQLAACFVDEGASPTLKTLLGQLAGPATNAESAFAPGFGFLAYVFNDKARTAYERASAVYWTLDALAEGRAAQDVVIAIARPLERLALKEETWKLLLWSWWQQVLKRQAPTPEADTT